MMQKIFKDSIKETYLMVQKLNHLHLIFLQNIMTLNIPIEPPVILEPAGSNMLYQALKLKKIKMIKKSLLQNLLKMKIN